MEINLSDSQSTEILEDEWITVEFSKGAAKYRLYLELDEDKNPFYFEIVRLENGKTIKGYAFNTEDLDKLIAAKPDDPSYYHNDPLCPTCRTYMIYKFEHCPRCGQKLDWSGRDEQHG